MHIKDVEQRTGLSRANIRYYEQEGWCIRPGGKTAIGTTAR